MSKEAPALTISIDDSGATARDLSNDIQSCNWATPRGEYDTTGVDKTARERLLGLADFSATFNGTFNDASNMSHDVFKSVPSASVTRTVSIGLSGQTLAPECVLTDYQLAKAADGNVTYTVPAALQSGTAPTWA